MPGWATVAVVASCLVGGAWLLWWFVAGSAPRERTVTFSAVPREARRARGGGGGAVSSMFRQLTKSASGVLVVRDGEWRVKSGDAVMRVQKRADGGYDRNFYYDRDGLVPPEELALLTFRASVVNDDAAARAAGITPRQMEAFKKLQNQTGMVIADADRQQLAAIWEAHAASPDPKVKTDREQAMVERLGAIGKQNLEATKQQMMGRAALVKSLLTPEQLKRVRQ